MKLPCERKYYFKIFQYKFKHFIVNIVECAYSTLTDSNSGVEGIRSEGVYPRLPDAVKLTEVEVELGTGRLEAWLVWTIKWP